MYLFFFLFIFIHWIFIMCIVYICALRTLMCDVYIYLDSTESCENKVEKIAVVFDTSGFLFIYIYMYIFIFFSSIRFQDVIESRLEWSVKGWVDSKERQRSPRARNRLSGVHSSITREINKFFFFFRSAISGNTIDIQRLWSKKTKNHNSKCPFRLYSTEYNVIKKPIQISFYCVSKYTIYIDIYIYRAREMVICFIFIHENENMAL